MNFATLHFDTYKVVSLLTERGYSKEQAEGFIQAVQEVTISGVATKEDLQLSKDSLQKEIRDLEIRLGDKIDKGLSGNLKFQIIQTITIVSVMVALFSLSLAS